MFDENDTFSLALINFTVNSGQTKIKLLGFSAELHISNLT